MVTLTTFNDFYIISITILLGSILYFKWVFYYSKNSHVPLACKPKIPFGTIPPFKEFVNPGIEFKKWYLPAKSSGYKIIRGFYGFVPYYVIIDPQYFKQVSRIDFDSFPDRGFYYDEDKDPLNANLLTFSGQKWNFVRSKLSPAFTAAKIKATFDTLLQCGYQMEEAVQNKRTIHLNELATCYTINVSGSYAFGIDCNSFKDPNLEFKKQGEEVFKIDVLRFLKIYTGFVFPNLASKLKICIFSKTSTNFFTNLVKDVVEYRFKNNVTRNDMMQLLMELNKTGENDSTSFDIKKITAEAFLFFAAGFETSAISLIHCIYELALNEDVQNKLRDEIDQVLKTTDGKITYDALTQMKYLGQVIDETLRKYPPLMYWFRKARKSYTIPGTNVELGVDTMLFYSIYGIHYDPEFYPEPEKFDPERFTPENKKRVPSYAYLPFGDGPRICVGTRLAIIQMQIAVILLFRKYKLTLNEKTKLPLKYKILSLTLLPTTQIYLNVEPVECA